MLPGIGVGTIMSILAICTGTPLEPLPLKVHHQRRLLHRARPVFPRFHANRSVTTL